MSAEVAAHMVGDFLVQSDWMAQRKTSSSIPAALHAASYAACFLPLTRDLRRLAVIGATHFVIDRWRLARYVVWAKNQLAPHDWRHPWQEHVAATGYHRELPGSGTDRCHLQGRPDWMAVWLLIFADNAMHLVINHCALIGGQRHH